MKRRRGLAFLLVLVLALTLMPVPGEVRAESCRGNNGGSHNWELVDPMGDPTCTEPGLAWYGCTYCGAGEERVIPALGHSWGGWVTTVTPTCVQEGWQQRTCSRCGEVQRQSLGYGGHSFGGWTTTAWPSCVQEGRQQRTCSICGETQTQSLGYGDHNWGSWYTEQYATCYQQGINARVCQTCCAYESYYTGYGSPNWGSWYTEREATCTQQGIQARVCRDCGEYESYYTDYAPHTWGEWALVTEATDFSPALWERTCSVCGETESQNEDPEGTLRRGDRGDAVAAMQQALNDAGFDCGEVDGVFGGNTEGALKAYALEKGFAEDGVGWPGVQKSLLRGNFKLPQSEYSMDLVVGEPVISIIGDNEMYEVEYDIFFTYHGAEDLQQVQAGEIEYVGDGSSGEQLGGAKMLEYSRHFVYFPGPECEAMDQAYACLYLASKMGRAVRGQVLQVCNGAFL